MKPAHLRNGILIFAAALIVAIGAFFLHARWLARRLSRDLPYELAKSIQQSTQGFTHSESRGGHTLYTLHASKAVQFKADGHAELHDVSITLFDAQGAPANRIYGSAFDWDPVKGIARALGEVDIDLQANASLNPKQAANVAPDGDGKGTVHVKTSGLTFNKETGLASTPEKIEFRLAAAAGSAVGASFNSQTGVVVLNSDVAFNSSLDGNPLSIRAHHAQFDRDSRLLYLLQEVADFEDSHSSSDQATISFREDGSASRVEEAGNVLLTSAAQRITTRKAHIDLGPKSEPVQASMEGGLLYVASDQNRQLHGTASSGTLLLGPLMSIRHAQLRDAVSLVEAETFAAPDSETSHAEAGKAKQHKPVSSSRQIQATRMDVDFAPGGGRSPQAEHIIAAGAARLNVHTIYSNTPPQDTTVQGDELVATLAGGVVLTSLRGTGHTGLVEISPNGAKQRSTGDTLLLTFAANKGSASQMAAQLQSVVQMGNVTLTQEASADSNKTKGAGSAGVGLTTAVAEKASYDATSQIVQLSGNPRIRNGSGELSAGAIAVEHDTGNANASDGVKATYHQEKGQKSVPFSAAGSVHVVSDRAHLDHATGLTTFYGKPGTPARLWQGSDSITAPVLELSRANSTLAAHAVSGDAAAVSAILVSEPASQRKGAPPAAATAAAPVLRLQSRTLLYAEDAHRATFSGAVVAQTATGALHANAMDIYFSPASPPPSSPKQESQAGSRVERIVARGAVELLQPGRKGTGEELTYTAADSKFMLTGTSSAPPRLSDDVRGSVTGTSLIFNDRDDSVIVSGGASKAVIQTRVAR